MEMRNDRKLQIKDACEQVLDELTAILVDYESWDDPLSKRIFKWGAEVLQFDLTDKREFTEVFRSNVEKRINHLVREILVNPLDKAPLKKPLLVDAEWVWEEWMYKDYVQFSAISPFNGNPMKDVVSHVFAEKMIQWAEAINLFILDFDFSSTSITAVQEQKDLMIVNGPVVLSQSAMTGQAANSQVVAQSKWITYTILARNAQLEKQLQLMNKEIEHSTQTVEYFRKQMELMIQQEKALAVQHAQAHEQALNQRINQIENAHVAVIDTLNSSIEAGFQQLKNTQEKLELTEQNCRSKEEQIQNLFLEERRRAEDSMLHEKQVKEQIKRIDKTHQEHEKQIKQQMAQKIEQVENTQREHEKKVKEQIKQIDETHQDNVSVLNSRIDHESRQRQATQAQLSDAQEVCQRQAKDISQLRKAYAQKTAEIERMRKQDHGSRFCSVM